MNIYNEEYFKDKLRYESKKIHYREIVSFVYKLNAKSVLDVGCGNGVMISKLLKGRNIKAIGMDFSEYAGSLIPNNFILADATKKFPFEDDTFDLVTSSDFFEHLEEKDIDFVYSEMRRVGKNVSAVISPKKDIGHLTIHKKQWWLDKLPGIIIINKFNLK